MAATMSAWSKPGAWALDSEENEQDLLNQPTPTIPESDFPSLDAVSKTKTKKKKPQKTLSLSQFATYSVADNQKDELLNLPTAPRERTEEELNQSRLGGGFRSYDGNRGSRGGFGREGGNREFGGSRADENHNWGATKKSSFVGGGFDRESNNREFGVSRADENENWGAGKKANIGGGGGFERRERGEKVGFFSDSSLSRADEVDNWAANKAFVESDGRRNERRGGFEVNGGGGGADSENWMRKKENEGQKFGGSFDSLRSRRGGNESMNIPDSDTWGRKREEGNGNGVVGARPRLNLQPRTKPLGDGQQKGDDDVVKPKGSNPFGEARPREEVLKEKGQDYKEIDEKLEAVKVKEGVSSPDGKRGFGINNGRVNSSEGRTENAWRKPLVLEPSRCVFVA
ncbi:translation initiation factor [Lithospermum erythrorhizon]|uniref:Translation initiation factor n=1 Tax=Lithospermum erythrorhizon TaxID=34254 RepID=A0AAV3Q6N7_LITER